MQRLESLLEVIDQWCRRIPDPRLHAVGGHGHAGRGRQASKPWLQASTYQRLGDRSRNQGRFGKLAFLKRGRLRDNGFARLGE